jgi:hypothetical protein
VVRKVKTLNPKQSKKPGRAPLVAALEEMAGVGASTFDGVESIYLRAMHEFDGLVAAGTADQGDVRNGKGDFLNDVLALLLANCSGKQLHTRPNVPGLSFRRHKLDIAYPAKGDVQLVIETKATGLPKHPGSRKQKHPDGRAGSADLEKRIKEASFKNIDIKAEAARKAGKGEGPTSDLGSWLRSAPPRCLLFLAVRVRDEGDLKKSIEFGHIASTWFDACGLYCYGWDSARQRYETKPVGATSLELDRVLSNVCTALRAMD